MRHAAIALLLIAGQAPSQPASPKPKAEAGPAFEVASIKQSNSLDRGNGRSGWEPGGRFRGVNVPGDVLVSIAYGTPQRILLSYQVAGAPSWLSSARYDIVGKVRSDLASIDPSELGAKGPLFLRSLLEDRFKLRVHHEQRELLRYRLVRARPDGALGPRLRQSNCPSGPEFCKYDWLTGHLIFEGVPLARFADDISGFAAISRVVVDDTRLPGRFDIELEWSPDPASGKADIFTAVQEQLGLKLQAERGPVDVVVIDSVERPTED
jgi:uncharacterized protein (TIGR03435 family)